MKKAGIKVWILVAAVVLLLGTAVGVLFATGILGGNATIKLDLDDVYFEFGKKMNLPDTTVFDGFGKEIAYDSACIAMIAPDGTEVDISTGFVTPMQVGEYVLTYASASTKTKKDIKIECRDTIYPTLNIEIPEAYLIKEKYENTEFAAHTLPILSADDLAGIDATKTEVKITVDGKDIPLNGDQFTITEEGTLVFSITVYDLNGLSTSVTKESIAELPEFFEPNCLSTFAKETYLTKLCGGWLKSYYTTSILDSDTDPSGATYEGVLQITYDASDTEAGACIHLARPVLREEVRSINVTLRIVGNKKIDNSNDAVFYPANYYNGYWTTSHVTTPVGENYVTIKIAGKTLDKMTDEDGYIRQFQIETLGDGSTARSIYLADISYTASSAEIEYSGTAVLQILELGAGSNDAVFLNTSATTGLPDYTDFDDVCNEETHILINGKAWVGNRVVKTGGATVIVLKGLNAQTGDKLTIKKGFYAVFNDIKYTTNRDYNYQWNGTKWVALDSATPSDPSTPADPVEPTETDVLKILELGTGSNNAQFFNINATNDLPDYTVLNNRSNEETHILINGQLWTNNAEIKTGGPNVLVFKGMNASVGTQMTIKEGFYIIFGTVKYITNRDYNYQWDGTAWVSLDPEEPDEPTEPNEPTEPGTTAVLKILELGVGSNNAQFFNINATNDLPDYYALNSLSNEETHILIDGQPWSSNAEIKTGGPNVLVLKGMNASEGTKMTIKEGFYIIFGTVKYITDRDYNYQWNGAVWVSLDPEEPNEPTEPTEPTEPDEPTEPGTTSGLNIVELGAGSNNAQFFNVDVTNNLADWTILNDQCNEETHILIDDQPWSGERVVKTGGPNTIVFTGLNAANGSKLTIKNGFYVIFGDTKYITDRDYNYLWNGTVWEPLDSEEPTDPPTDPTEPSNPTNSLVVDGINGECPNQILMSLPVNPDVKIGTKLTIQSGFTMIIDGVDYGTAQNYDFWWNGTAWTTEEVEQKEILTFTELGAGGANAQFFNVNVTNDHPDYTVITDKCNEETHVLIDGQPWTSNAEIKTGGPRTLVFKGMNASVGTTMTIMKGFYVTFGDVKYVTDQDYNYQWNGTAWVLQENDEPTEPTEPEATEPEATEPEVLTIVELGAGSSNAQFFNVNATNDLPDYTDITASCNEETHVLINDAPWTGSPVVKTGGKKVIVFTGLNASVDTKLTIKKGFSVTFGDVIYVTDKEYNYWWNGTIWSNKDPASNAPVLTITELGNGSSNAQFFNVNVTNNLPDYTIITDKCNEETHILINGQPWTTNAEIKTGGPNTLVFKGMNASIGTTMTIKKGFTVTFGDKTYVTDKYYYFEWNGSTWVPKESESEE